MNTKYIIFNTQISITEGSLSILEMNTFRVYLSSYFFSREG